MAKIQSQQLAFQAQLLEPELVFRSIGFTAFLSTWLIRLVDPKKTHPKPIVEYVSLFGVVTQHLTDSLCRLRLPLPKEVPMAFKALPEYLIEDVVDYLIFVVQSVPLLLFSYIFVHERS